MFLLGIFLQIKCLKKRHRMEIEKVCEPVNVDLKKGERIIEIGFKLKKIILRI